MALMNLLMNFLDDNSKQAVFDIYVQNNFPFQVRDLFSWVIESYKITEMNEYEHFYVTVIDSLLQEIHLRLHIPNFYPEDVRQNLMCILNDLVVHLRILSCHRLLRWFGMYGLIQAREKLELFLKLKACLENEKSFGNFTFLADSQGNRILGSFNKLLEDVKCRDKLLENVDNNNMLMVSIIKEFEGSKKLIGKLQSRFLNKLALWKYDTRFVERGTKLKVDVLDKIKSHCSYLAQIISHSLAQIKNTEVKIFQNCYLHQIYSQYFAENFLQTLKTEFANLLQELVTSTFIVIENPPEVLNKSQKFSVTTVHLTGNQIIVDPGKAEVFLLSEAEAKIFHQGNQQLEKKCFDKIDYNAEKLWYSKKLSVDDRPNACKQKESSEDKKVMENKLALLFTCKIQVLEFQFVVSTVSLPLVITSHFSQKHVAFGTIYWDNEFSSFNREPFEVPKSVDWSRLAVLLNRVFMAHADRILTPPELETLKIKLLGSDSGDNITWDQFCKTKMQDKEFSFWEWLFEILKMIKGPLNELWRQKRIEGICEKEIIEKKLERANCKTFVLRFSESVLGSLSVVWRHTDKTVKSLAPVKVNNDAALQQLARKILGLNKYFQDLHPGIPKKVVFKKYESVLHKFTHLFYVPVISDVDLPQSNICTQCPRCGHKYNVNESSTSSFSNINDDMDVDNGLNIGEDRSVSFNSKALLVCSSKRASGIINCKKQFCQNFATQFKTSQPGIQK